MFTFNELKKLTKTNCADCKKIKVAIIGDSATQFITTSLKGYGIKSGIDFEIFEAEYNQIDLTIINTNSQLYQFDPNFILINFSVEHLVKQFYKCSLTEKNNFASNFIAHLLQLNNIIFSNLKCKIICNTVPEINDSIFGNIAAKTNQSFLFQIRKINFLLSETAMQNDSLLIADVAALQSQNGRQFIFDEKMYLQGDFTYSLNFLPTYAKNICDIINANTGVFKKCLIVDLDNTLWGGIIGDDGINGIQIGELGIGKAFTEFQLWIKELKNRGIILAVCSKNTESVAKEPFEQNSDMVLKYDDFAMFVANWETKVDNINFIQQTLNIGMDSIVFLDDNPFEREMVKSAIKEITVPELPEDPAEYLSYLRTLNLFETPSVLDEDIDRTKQYQEESKRIVFQKSFQNEKQFLKSLNMVAELKAIDEFTCPRVAQLTQRSNQFNVRTIRYSEKEINEIIKSNEYKSFTFSLKDKFGDHGLIGIIILQKQNKQNLFIDTLIMSCRVLKRTMEHFMLNTIVHYAKQENFEKIIGEYLPTKKNKLVENLYAELGFTEIDGKWHLEVEKYKYKFTSITE